MKKFLAKIIIVLVIGSLLGWSLFYFWKNKYAIVRDEAAIERSGSEIKKTGVPAAGNDKKISDGKAEMISYIEKNINKISPQKPISGAAWHPVKIWFINEANFYVDYKDEVFNIRRILVYQSMGGPRAEYEVLGFFIPGENGWMLKSGRDIAGANTLKLYEKNEQNNEWTAK